MFGIPGEENIRLTEALVASGIRYILVRHEQAASFMAEIYGRLTGRAGVCSSTLGPGAINLLLGVADATTNSTPLVAVSAQVGLNRIYKESHQSVDLVSMFDPVTKWAALVPTAGSVPEMVRKAFKLAQTERPGAVYLAVPEDIEALEAVEGSIPLPVNVPRSDEPSPSQIARVVEVLDSAQQPVVLAGHGAARAGAKEALIRFSETLGLAVATTFHGKGVFPDDHPHALGAVGFMRHDYVNFGFDAADVIIAVGFELQEFDPVKVNPDRDKRIVHLSRFPAEVDNHYDVEVGPTSPGPSIWWPRRPSGASRRRRWISASAPCSPTNWRRPPMTTASPSNRSGWWRTPVPLSDATTSSWPTPVRSRCGWHGCTRPTSPTPA